MGRSEANLQKITKEIAKARGRAGGIASGKKRRELKTARDFAKMLLDLPISPQQEKIAAIAEAYGIKKNTFTQKGLALLAVMLKAERGDVEATRFLLSLVGELPAVKTETTLTGPDNGPVLVMGVPVERHVLQRARQIEAEIRGEITPADEQERGTCAN